MVSSVVKVSEVLESPVGSSHCIPVLLQTFVCYERMRSVTLNNGVNEEILVQVHVHAFHEAVVCILAC